MIGSVIDAVDITARSLKEDENSNYFCLMSKPVSTIRPRPASSCIADSKCTTPLTFDRSPIYSWEVTDNATVGLGKKDKTLVSGKGSRQIKILVAGKANNFQLFNV